MRAIRTLALLISSAFALHARAETALFFDGVNDFITFGPASTLGVSNFTVEIRFNRLGTGQTASTGTGGTIAVPLISKGRNQADGSNLDMNFFLGITNNVLVADFENFASGANHPVNGRTVITNGVWYHAAATYDGQEWRLYLNGVLETNLVVGQAPRYDSIQHAGIATAMDSTGVTNGMFRGYLREARIWNHARTAGEIAANINTDITNATGLVGRWGLNDSTGTVVTDTSGSNVTGILSNGPAWTNFSSPTNLVFIGDVWRYFKGTSYPTGWETNGFNDTGWLTGPSGFGYGDGDDTTVLSDMQNNYLTVFTRREFIISTNAEAVTAIILGADYDDGFVAFINGVEVARRSMPAGPISNTTTGFSHNAGTRSAILLTNDFITLLKPGNPSTNLIAVSAHNTTLGSSDLTLLIDLSYSTDIIPPVLTRQPYLQLGTPTNITVRWRTDIACNSRVRFGNSHTNLTGTVDDLASVTEHEVKLTGLLPDTRYYYSVGTTSQTLSGGNADHYFVTAPTPGTEKPTLFWVTGDFGTGDASQTNVMMAYRNYAGTNYTDAILMLGDNAYESGTDQEFTTKLFTPYAPLIRQSVSWPCVGNHDVITSSGSPYFDSFTMPTGAEAGGVASGTERYYSFDYANIHFICLDSQLSTRTLGSPMLNWLQNDLNSTTQKWLIAFWHHPPYSKGSHNSDTDSQMTQMRTNVVPVLEAAGVDLILCGHSHVYERSRFIDGHYGLSTTFTNTMLVDTGDGRENGTGAYQKNLNTPHSGAVYAVTGSGGKLSGTWIGGSTLITNPAPHPAMIVSLREHGSMALEINGDRLTAKFINTNNVVRDYFTIIKGATFQIATALAPAAETGPLAGTFALTRTGATNTAVTVYYTVSGTASNGADYVAMAGNVTLPVGVSATNLVITPIGDNIAEGTETVSVTLLASNQYAIASPHNAVLSILDRPLDDWRHGYFAGNANNPAIAGDTADPEGDGLLNLMEYALGLDPTIASIVNTPVAATESDHLTLTFRRRKVAPDIAYAVEVTGDVNGGWTTLGVNYSVTGDDGTFETVKATDPGTISGSGKRFMRLRVTRP